MKYFQMLVCTLGVALATPGFAEDVYFDYSAVERIEISDSSDAYLYGKFHEFHRLKQIIESAMRDAKSGDVPSQAVFTARLYSGDDEHTIYIGDAWVGNGEKAAMLDESDFAWVVESVTRRALEQ